MIATTNSHRPSLPDASPRRNQRHHELLVRAYRPRDISNALNKIQTLCNFLCNRLLLFSTIYRLTRSRGTHVSPSDTFICQKRKKAPDRLGGGNPGLGG